MRFDAVSFDCWGTLLVDFDWEQSYARRVELLARAVRPLRSITDEQARMALDASWRTHYLNWEDGQPSGASEMALEAVRTAAGDACDEAGLRVISTALALGFSSTTLDADIRPVPGSAKVLESLHRSGVRLGMICDTGFATGATVRLLLDRAGLLQSLPTQIFSDEWGVPKPHPRLFWAALADMEVEAERAAHVGDLGRTDIRGAKDAGMTAIRLAAHYDDPAPNDESDFVVHSHEALQELLLPAQRSAQAITNDLAEPIRVEAAFESPDFDLVRRLSADSPNTIVVEDAFGVYQTSADTFRWIPRPWAASERKAQHAEVDRALMAVSPALRESIEMIEIEIGDDLDSEANRQNRSSEPSSLIPLHALTGRFPQDGIRLDQRIQQTSLRAIDLHQIASAVSAIHKDAARSDAISYRATAEKLASEIRRLGQVLQNSKMETRVFEKCEESLLGFVLQRSDLFRSRVAGDHIRHIHGDLRVENVMISNSAEVTLLPPLHFAVGTATADPCLDVATLAIDLEPENAERFANAYAEASLDFESLALFDFYRRFAAFSRAARSALSLSRIRHPSSRRLNLSKLVACERAILKIAPPRSRLTVATTGGKVGTGKSTISRMASEALDCVRIEVDELSAQLVEAPPVEPVRYPLDQDSTTRQPTHEADWERMFASGFREGVYAEVFRQARAVLGSGRSVVLDGCFGTRLCRQEAERMAREFNANFLFIECQLDPEVHQERLRAREQARHTSTGTWNELASEFAAAWQDVNEFRASEHLKLDTQLSKESARKKIGARLSRGATAK